MEIAINIDVYDDNLSLPLITNFDFHENKDKNLYEMISSKNKLLLENNKIEKDIMNKGLSKFDKEKLMLVLNLIRDSFEIEIKDKIDVVLCIFCK